MKTRIVVLREANLRANWIKRVHLESMLLSQRAQEYPLDLYAYTLGMTRKMPKNFNIYVYRRSSGEKLQCSCSAKSTRNRLCVLSTNRYEIEMSVRNMLR